MKRLWFVCHTVACLVVGYVVGVHFPGSATHQSYRHLMRETHKPFVLIVGTNLKEETGIWSRRVGYGRVEALWLPEEKVNGALERLDEWMRDEMVRARP